jgi:hypothetical protein
LAALGIKERRKAMKRVSFMLAMGIGFWLSMTSWLLAMDPVKGHDHAAGLGVQIHHSSVDGFRLDYYLLRLENRKMEHLMVVISGPDGKPVAEAKVGFLVIAPDGSRQKVMTMPMKEGFGGDVDFGAKGAYRMKTKAVFGDKKLFDEFSYEVK